VSFIETMDCLPVSKLPEGPKWTYEIKLDGYRLEVVRRGRETTLYSRRQNVVNKKFQQIASALKNLPGDTVIDGEVVAIGADGRPDFNLLQNFRSAESRIHYYVFDILIHQGQRLTELPLSERRAILTSVIEPGEHVAPPHRMGAVHSLKSEELKMNRFLPLFLLFVAGCSNMQTTVHPNLKPQESQTTTPTVAMMGDDQIIGLVNYVSNPLWSCTTCAQGQQSGAVLAEVPAVIAQHPNIAVILTGAYDEIDNPQYGHAEPTVGNISTMCGQLEAAGIKPLVFFLPDSTAYDDYWTNMSLYDAYTAGLVPNVLTYPIDPNGPYVQYTAGVDFSQAGLAAVYPLAYQQIEGFRLGGEK
jgi:hypothetical protein